jgi:hypothetical protein
MYFIIGLKYRNSFTAFSSTTLRVLESPPWPALSISMSQVVLLLLCGFPFSTAPPPHYFHFPMLSPDIIFILDTTLNSTWITKAFYLNIDIYLINDWIVKVKKRILR